MLASEETGRKHCAAECQLQHKLWKQPICFYAYVHTRQNNTHSQQMSTQCTKADGCVLLSVSDAERPHALWLCTTAARCRQNASLLGDNKLGIVGIHMMLCTRCALCVQTAGLMLNPGGQAREGKELCACM